MQSVKWNMNNVKEQYVQTCLLKKISIFAASTFDLYIHPYGHAQVMASCNHQGINQPSVEKNNLSSCSFPPVCILKGLLQESRIFDIRAPEKMKTQSIWREQIDLILFSEKCELITLQQTFNCYVHRVLPSCITGLSGICNDAGTRCSSGGEMCAAAICLEKVSKFGFIHS